MASPYVQTRYPEPPANLSPEMRVWAQELVKTLHRGEVSLAAAFEAAEPYAQLQPIGSLPERYGEGTEIEADATLGATLPGGLAGKYVLRSGVWVFLG